LAFLSDFMFAGAPLSRHTVALPGPHLFVASLDHCLWFHRDVRCDDWLLFETDGPNAANGVNLARGLIYNRAGELVASMVQEALQYPVDPAG
jgi:acyl-CoA thioesterase-2